MLSFLSNLVRCLLHFFLPRQCYCSNFTCDIVCEKCFSFFPDYLSFSYLNSSRHFFFVTYQSIVKVCFHEIKFSLNKNLIYFLKDRLTQLKFTDQYDYWVPVPYHPKKVNHRGFNLINDLFLSFFETKSIPCLNLLSRDVDTVPLFEKSALERKDIISGVFSFALDPNVIKGKRILVVDDIVSSGTTISECVQLIKNHVHCDVDVFSFAKVADNGQKKIRIKT